MGTSIFYPRLGERNTHYEAARRHFGDIKGAPADLPAELTFLFLCFTNRVGSNFLSDLLASTRHFKVAGEYLNDEVVVRHATEHGHRSLQEYFAWLVRTRASKHNIVVIKLAIQHLEMLGDAGLLDQIVDRSRFVFLTRGDRLDQAISREVAWHTRKWSSKMASVRPDQPPRYNARGIRQHMASVAEHNRLFETFFARNRLEPLRIVYERLVAEPELHVREIGRLVGFSRQLEIDPARLSFARQAGSLNAEWRARFLAEMSATPLRRILQWIGTALRRPSP